MPLYANRERTGLTSSEGSSNVSRAGSSQSVPGLVSAVDQAQLDAGKKALKELLKEKRKAKKNRDTWRSQIKIWVTVLAGLMICLGLICLMFLVPIIIDPALATLTYQFTDEPVLCMTVSAEWVIGQSNISWCSCTEGCTSEIFRCSQISVVYQKTKLNISKDFENKLRQRRDVSDFQFGGDMSQIPDSNNIFRKHGLPIIKNVVNDTSDIYKNESMRNISAIRETHNLGIDGGILKVLGLDISESYLLEEWPEGLDDEDVDLLSVNGSSGGNNNGSMVGPNHHIVKRNSEVSTEGGVPVHTTLEPSVYDTEFWDVFNASLFINVKGCGFPPEVNCSTFFSKFGVIGRRYPCYYSTVDDRLVMTEYHPDRARRDITLSLGWTIGAQVLGLITILILHLPFKSYIKAFKSSCEKRGTQVLQAK
ncbi:unnamed protein product [Meganyctiphanes norvegica]|uniref:Protein tipE n=1 Tax=Meganyctiphanes norvegica TaxID=48144 RepID=A0AAV2QTN6_MEGNR